jgi:hypothetical protein
MAKVQVLTVQGGPLSRPVEGNGVPAPSDCRAAAQTPLAAYRSVGPIVQDDRWTWPRT